MGPKAEYMAMARAVLDNFPTIKVDVYALAYCLQSHAEEAEFDKGPTP